MENEDQNLVFFRKLFIYTEVLGTLCVLLIALWIFVFRGGFAWSNDPLHEVYWHPFLSVLGLVFLYANGTLLYRGFRSERKKKLKVIHTLIFLTALIFSVLGTVAIFDYQSVLGINNMYSLHSWMGLIVIILFAFQLVAGFSTFLFPGLRTTVRAAYLPVHQVFGLLIFVGAVSTSLVGFTEKAIYVLNGNTPDNPSYTSFPVEGILINIIGLILLIFACMVMYLTASPQFRRQIPEEQPLLTPNSHRQTLEEPLLTPNSRLQTSGDDPFVTSNSSHQTSEAPLLAPSFHHQMAEEEAVTSAGIRSPASEEEALLKHLLSV